MPSFSSSSMGLSSVTNTKAIYNILQDNISQLIAYLGTKLEDVLKVKPLGYGINYNNDIYFEFWFQFSNSGDQNKLYSCIDNGLLTKMFTEFGESIGIVVEVGLEPSATVKLSVTRLNESQKSTGHASSITTNESCNQDTKKVHSQCLERDKSNVSGIPDEKDKPMLKKVIRVYSHQDPHNIYHLCVLHNKKRYKLKNIIGTKFWETELHHSAHDKRFDFSVECENYLPRLFGLLTNKKGLTTPVMSELVSVYYVFLVFPTPSVRQYYLHAVCDILRYIVDVVAKRSQKEGIEQLRAVTTETSLPPEVPIRLEQSILTVENCKFILKNSQKNMQVNESNSLAFCYFLHIVTVGNIFLLTEKWVDVKNAVAVLNSCARLSNDLIPSICARNIANVMQYLSKMVYKSEASVLLLLHLTIELFENEVFLEFIENSLDENKLVLPLYKTTTTFNCCNLLITLYNFASHDKKILSMVERIFRHLPFDQHVLFLQCIKEMDAPTCDLLAKIKDSLIFKTNKEIINFGKKGDLENLSSTWNSVLNLFVEIPDSLIEPLERAILIALDNNENLVVSNSSNALMQLLKRDDIFASPIQQIKLFTLLSKTKTNDLLDILLNLLDLPKHATLDSEKMCQIIGIWFLAVIKDLKETPSIEIEKIAKAYHYFHDIINSAYVTQHNIIQNRLEDIILRMMQQTFSFKTIILAVPQIEQIPNASLLYSKHVHRMLRDGHFGKSLNQVIQDICGPGAQRLTVNTEFTSGLVLTTIEMIEVPVDDTFESIFGRIVESSSFWIVILTATGKFVESIRQHNKVLIVQKTINNIIYNITHRYITTRFLLLLKNRESEAKQLLTCTLDSNDAIRKVEQELDKCHRQLGAYHENIIVVENTFKSIKDSLVSNLLKDTLDYISRHKKDILHGNVSIDKLFQSSVECKNIQKLADCCRRIKDVVCTCVFWNVNAKSVYTTAVAYKDTDNMQDENVFDEISLPQLFNEDVQGTKPLQIGPVLKIVELLSTDCLKNYTRLWRYYEKENEQSLLEMRENFRDVEDMEWEIEQAQKMCFFRLKEESRNCLMQFANLNSYSKTVDTIKIAARAFMFDYEQDSLYRDTVHKFEQLLNNQFEGVTLKGIRPLLQNIDEVHRIIGAELQNVLNAVQKSTELLNFLREVIDDDIRNLIDAVEEHSEQYVRESTVSDLIEVKQFFKPILKGNFTKNIRGLFDLLQKQINYSVGNKIPDKIFVCRSHLHSLRALYRNVANRGERTIEVIENIMQKGSFHFSLNDKKCEINVEYRMRKKYTHTDADLSDFRSRALLIMNKDEKEKNRPRKAKLEKFVETVDDAFEIANLCFQLKQAGHFDFCRYKEVCSNEALNDLKYSLYKKYNRWLKQIEKCRQEFYYLNYLYSDQLYELYSFLHRDKKNEFNVMSVLRFIDPTIDNLQHIAKIYKSFQNDDNHMTALENIGETLNKLFEDSPTKYVKNIKSRMNVKMTDKVQPGIPYITSLTEGSPLVLRTLLALYLNTTGILPEAHQILFCRKGTTYEEISLLLNRCLWAKSSPQALYTIANIEMLSGEAQFKLHDAIRGIPPGGNFLLCLLFRGHEHHSFLDQFTDTILRPSPLSDVELRFLFVEHWSHVKVVTSDVPGLGKSEYIQQKAIDERKRPKTIHVSGNISKLSLIEDLIKLRLQEYHVLHIDVGSVADPLELDLILFELIVLRYLSAGSTAYALPNNAVYIEIANTVKQILCNSLPTVMCFTREHLHWNLYEDLHVSSEINSPMQVVCHYLKSLDEGLLDMQDLYFNGPNCLKPLTAIECGRILSRHFYTVSDMSFTLMNILLNVLADQLKKLSASVFFRCKTITAMLGEGTIPSVKSNLVRALINVSLDFSSRSIHTCRSTQVASIIGDTNEDAASIMATRVSGMIRWEDNNHLVILFHHNMQTISALYRNVNDVPRSIIDLFETQVKTKLAEFKDKTSEELKTLLVMLTRSNYTSGDDKLLCNLMSNYALTPDNLLKMVLISLRINAKVPVLIMGETGCGKTTLIRFLAHVCGVRFDVYNIHAGITESDILQKLENANKSALAKVTDQFWLFLDEINTCDHLGLISCALCHRAFHSKEVAPNLVLLAACNPYRLRTKETIFSTGLQGKIKTDELSRLVYRVHPLPENVIDFVWDYGSLSDTDEVSYILKMVEKLFEDEWASKLLADILVMSQRFVRKVETNDYCVSLRDVDRCRRLTKWFDNFISKRNTRTDNKDRHVKAIILGMSVCYHSRFSIGHIRQEYRKEMRKCFLCALYKISECEIQDIILSEQKYIISKMTDLPVGIAMNVALQENVFMLLVCILNKIPIFLVGKPGCSKSLSMQLIRSNLRGKDSTDPLFQEMPQLFCVSFQGSESSTSEGILKVFEKAENYQNHNDEKDILSVVLLDEIGLAEISRFNPLKVLHGLIEPEENKLKVAVVGISNWALDAAKMNRAVHLSRPDMDLEELIYTGHSINTSMLKTEDDNTFKSTNSFFNSGALQFESKVSVCGELINGIASAYYEYCCPTQKFANFHGLRDFYSMIKYIGHKAKIIQHANDEELSDIILVGILRNFGGLPTERDYVLEVFRKHIPQFQPRQIPVTQLIHENILDKSSRHLMLITNGDAVLSVLESLLGDIGMPFDIIFGSSFEDDLSDDYNYRILSRIILCMEQGMVLILKDLESIYGSLYDMLNQNYTIVGKKKNCRIALGQYSNPMCHVHDDFKCIVLVEESKLDYSDPPFLNRFEKQHFEFTDLLYDERLKNIVKEINDEVVLMCHMPNHTFLPCDVIPTYCQHLLVSLIIHSSRVFDSTASTDCIKRYAYERLILLFPPEVMIRSAESALCMSRKANDVRLLINKYMLLPIHGGVWSYLDHMHTTFVSPAQTNLLLSSDVVINKIESLNVQNEEDLSFSDLSCSKILEQNFTSNTITTQNNVESEQVTRKCVDTMNQDVVTSKFVYPIVDEITLVTEAFEKLSDKNSDMRIPSSTSDTDEKLDSLEHHKVQENERICIQMSEGIENNKSSTKMNVDTNCQIKIDVHEPNGKCTDDLQASELIIERSDLLCEHMSFVYTFAGINSVVEKEFSGRTVQKEKLSLFKSEKHLSLKVEEFVQSDINILLIQCSAATDHQHLLLAKVIVEKCIRRNKSMLRDADKFICIIIHLERQSKLEIPCNFLSGWRLVFLDSIEKPKTQLKHFLEVEKLQIVKERMPLNNYIKDSLFWGFSRIKFTKHNSVEHLEMLLERIKSSSYAIETLEKCIISWIEKTSVDFSMLDMNDMNVGDLFNSSWCIDIASRPHELLKSGTFVGALENNIQEVIKMPLAIHLFQMLRLNLLNPVFVEDECASARRRLWTKTVLSEQYIKIKDIPAPTGPECYSCDIEFLNLNMPYSQMIMRQLEDRKVEYLDIIRRLRIANDIEPDDEMPRDLFHTATADCTDIICYDVLEIAEDIDYPGRNGDFIRDFCNLYSFTLLEAIAEDERVPIFKWVLSNFIDVDKLALGDFVSLIAGLHSVLWVYEHIIIAICELLMLTIPYIDVFHLSSSKQIKGITVYEGSCNYNDQCLFQNSCSDTTTEDEISTNIKFTDKELLSPVQTRPKCDKFTMLKKKEKEGTNRSDAEVNVQTVLNSRCDSLHDFQPNVTNENKPDIDTCVESTECYLLEDNLHDASFDIINTNTCSRKNFVLSTTRTPTNQSFSTTSNESDQDQTLCGISILSRACLVKTVCLALLPKQHILSDKPVDHGLSLITQILPLANIVHDESYELSGLKFCQELLDTFVGNIIVQNIAAEKFGDCLGNADCIIDSTEVCECLFDILKDLEIKHSVNKEVLQRLFCSYISRCLVSNPDNSAPLEFALAKICKGEMFDEYLSSFGQVIKFAVIIDLGEKPEGFQNILIYGQNQEQNDYPCFARCFNTCLSDLNSTCQNNHPFVILLMHIIEEYSFEDCLTVDKLTLAETSSNDIFSMLSVSFYIVKQGVLSLKAIIALAYIRKFIKVATELLASLKYNCSEISLICQHINSLLSSPEEGNSKSFFTTELIHLFLKCIEQRSGQQYIEQTCRMIEPFIPALKEIFWNLHFLERSPVFNPLFFHIDKDSFDLYLLQVMHVGQHNNTLQNLLLAEKGEIRILSVLAQKFYMIKCLKEKDDSEMQLSTNIAGIVAQTQMSAEIKHIISLLLGTIDFKHSIFNLSVMVESPQPQIVSVMIHLIGLICTVATRANIWYQTLMEPSNLTETLWPILKFESFRDPMSASTLGFSTVSINCMQIFLYSCLVSSIGLGKASINHLASLVGWEKANLHNELESQLHLYWNNLKTVLQLNYDDICILIHNMLFELTPLLHVEINKCIDLEFIQQHVGIIENCLANRIIIIRKTKKSFSTLVQDDIFTMEKCVTEIKPCYSVDKQIMNILLSRMNGSPSKNMFFTDLYLGNKAKFPLLKRVLENIHTLSLPKRILSIIKWHLSLVTCASYKFRRVDFKDLTIAKLFTLEHDEKRRQHLKNAFDAFKNDWNIIRSEYENRLYLEGRGVPSLELIHQNLKMESVTIFADEHVVLKILKALVNIQNSFLQDGISNTNDTCKVASVKLREVSLLDLKSDDLIRFEWKDKWLQFSQCDTRFGLGQKIDYDFEKIEQEIKTEVLFGKCVIKFPVLPKIVFMDELFQNSVDLLREIESIVPQNQMTVEIKKDIEKKTERDASQITTYLTYIGMMLSLIRKTGAQAENPISEYLVKWENITCIRAAEFKYMFNANIKLGHIVAIYNLLEELNGNNIVHSLEDKYRKPLSQETKEGLYCSKSACIKHFQKLDHALKVFIHRCLASTENAINVEQPLIDYLCNAEFWWKNDLNKEFIVDGDKIVALTELLSPMILVENICDTMQCVVNIVEDSRQKDVRISGITATYQHARIKEQPTRTRMKTAKKLMRT